MEVSQRCGRKMLHLVSGSRPWILPNFLDQRVKFLKNHKMKNAPGFLIVFRVIKKSENFQKSEHFWFFDDFRDRCPAWLGINDFLKIVYLRLGNVTETGNAHDFSWDDHGFVFLRRWKTHFCFFFISKICNAILLWQQWWKNVEFTKKYQTHRNSKQNRVVKK